MLTRAVGGLTTAYSYDAAGRLIRVSLPGNGTLDYTYSGDQVSSIIDSLGNTIGYQYDAKGQQTEVEIQDPGHRLMYALNQTYDQNGNLSKRLYPGGAEASYQYDAVHNLTAIVDPVRIRTDNSYDALNRLTGITESGTLTATYQHDQQGNVTSVVDARGNTTTTTYDDLGRVLEKVSPDAGLARFTSDLAGNVLSQTDAKNQTITFTYDELNRPVQQSYPNIARAIKLTYDNKTGRLSEIQEGYSSRSFAYNTRGQVIAETREVLSPAKLLQNLMKPVPKVAGGNVTATVGYGYDQATGQLASITYPSGRVVSYTRNAMGQIIAIQMDGQALAANINSLPFGPMQSATLGSIDLIRTFDQRYQIHRIQAGALDLQYSRDAAGRVSGVVNAPIPASGKSMTATVSPDSNRLLALNDGQVWNFTHDANGNVISEEGFTYTWDALNRLVQVKQDGAVVASYAYDTQNRRISKIVGDQVTHYHYDLNNRVSLKFNAVVRSFCII